MRIAYQSEKGIWMSPATKSLDTTARTLSVETTHFSDWSNASASYDDPVHQPENKFIPTIQSI
jgi:hypothetical protein